MTAVIYARYSSDNQREESIEGQIRECTAYAEKNGITVIKHYIDRAFSAKTDNRPEFQQMIKDSGKKLFDVVLVWKFDRFARNRFDSANYKMILKKNGVHLISVMEPIAEGSQGILVETLLEGMAEYYSAELSEKVIRGQTENALKGKCTGGTGTIGYKIDEDKFYHLDPLTAPLVLEAFQRYDNGDKMVEIVNFLNDKGVRNMLGGKMTHSSVNTMLKNRRYIGELSFRDIVVPDAIPVIVPKDLFDRVQKRLDKNKRAPACGKADEEYLLTTKLFCGKCGAPATRKLLLNVTFMVMFLTLLPPFPPRPVFPSVAFVPPVASTVCPLTGDKGEFRLKLVSPFFSPSLGCDFSQSAMPSFQPYLAAPHIGHQVSLEPCPSMVPLPVMAMLVSP